MNLTSLQLPHKQRRSRQAPFRRSVAGGLGCVPEIRPPRYRVRLAGKIATGRII